MLLLRLLMAGLSLLPAASFVCALPLQLLCSSRRSPKSKSVARRRRPSRLIGLACSAVAGGRRGGANAARLAASRRSLRAAGMAVQYRTAADGESIRSGPAVCPLLEPPPARRIEAARAQSAAAAVAMRRCVVITLPATISAPRHPLRPPPRADCPPPLRRRCSPHR